MTPLRINKYLERNKLRYTWRDPSPEDRVLDLITGSFLAGSRYRTDCPTPDQLSSFYALLHRVGSENWVVDEPKKAMSPKLMHRLYRFGPNLPVELGG